MENKTNNNFYKKISESKNKILILFLTITAITILTVYFKKNIFLFLKKSTSTPSQEFQSALKQDIIKEGVGKTANIGDTVLVHYKGFYLKENNFQKMEEVPFYSTYDQKQHVHFKIGANEVIPGIDFGVNGMKPGEIKKITVPPHLGYGKQGAGGGLVPPDAVLFFELYLISILSK